MSMFRSEICDSNLRSSLTILNNEDSKEMRALFDNNFVDRVKFNKHQYRWDAFKDIKKKFPGFPEDNLSDALSTVNFKSTDILFLIHDEGKDKDALCMATQFKNLLHLIEEYWYPSEDLYIFDKNANWVIALTHHDLLIVASKA